MKIKKLRAMRNNNHKPEADQIKLLSIIPLSFRNTPFKSWEKYKNTVAPISEWRSHLIRSGNVGIITGEVSGDLQVISIEAVNDLDTFIVEHFFDQIPINLLNKLLVIITPEKQYQIIYRSNIKTSSEVLATDLNQNILIRTIGEGEFFCFNYQDYHVLQGRFDPETFDIDIPLLSDEECDLLLHIGRNCQIKYN